MKKNNHSIVFLVQHVAHEDTVSEDVKLIGVFSSRAIAEQQIENLKKQPGFSRYKKGFYIGEMTVDEASWLEGFATVSNKPTGTRRASKAVTPSASSSARKARYVR